MAITLLHNIAGDAASGPTHELISANEDIRSVKSINIANTGSSNATVSVFIQDNPTSSAASSFKIIEDLVIPSGVSFLLDDGIPLSQGQTSFGLYITVGLDDTVDVIIKR
jgi:hypothetical protein